MENFVKRKYGKGHHTKRVYAHLGVKAAEALEQIEAQLLQKWKWAAEGHRPSISLILQAALIRFSKEVQHDPKELKGLLFEIEAQSTPFTGKDIAE